MMKKIKVKREQLIQEAQDVLLGLSKRAIIEDSECFVFTNGWVYTFNDEITCRRKSCLPIKGAVIAPYLKFLRKLNTMWVTVRKINSGLELSGHNWRRVFPMKKKVYLPKRIKLPKQWKPLPTYLTEAIDWVGHCAADDETLSPLTCVHIHPKMIEASDNQRAARYKIKTGFSEPIVIRRNSILSFIKNINPTEYGLTKEWIHFKDKQNLICSCRYWNDKYPKINFDSTVNAKTITWPKKLAEDIEYHINCINAAKKKGDKDIQIKIQNNKMTILSKTKTIFAESKLKINYEGKRLSFRTNAVHFGEMIKRYGNQCIIEKDKLIAGSGKIIYQQVYMEE